jgi:hypothetical protein
MSKTITEACFNAVLHLALHEGDKAYNACVPQPVVFFQAGTDPAKGERVDDGLCGFAWVTIKPATSAFARWLKKQVNDQYRIHKGCYGGLEMWPANRSQSHERKRAWAEAVACRLRAADLNAHAGDRLD